MISIPNYEIALSHLQDAQGNAVPIVALSFAAEDLLAATQAPWSQDSCRLEIVREGMHVHLAGHDALFPLSNASSSDDDLGQSTEHGLDRESVLEIVRAHQHLFVCAFNAAGDLANSIGFEMDPAGGHQAGVKPIVPVR